MKKNLRILPLLFLFLYTNQILAQGSLRVGPSVNFIYEYLFDEGTLQAYGGELGYKFNRRKNQSYQISSLLHFGKRTNRSGTIVRFKDVYYGINQEIHWHFEKTFDGGYFGVGLQLMFIFSEDLRTGAFNRGTIKKNQVDIGLTTGFNKSIGKEFYINPYAYFGFNPFGEDHSYQAVGRVGICLGLLQKKK